MRVNRAYAIRQKKAAYHKDVSPVEQPANGDESRFGNKIGNYSKGLPHDQSGEVDLESYQAMIRALDNGYPADLEKIPLGGAIKLTNPQAAFASCLDGPDSHELSIPMPPSFSSAEQAAEMIELYWQALSRDVPFAEYGRNQITNDAASELSNLSTFLGPKIGRRVSTATLFRADIPGVLPGPYISQFLWKDVPYGAMKIIQKIRTAIPAVDYMTSYTEWLRCQRGIASRKIELDTVPRYLRAGRDLARFVQVDPLYQAFLNAALILLGANAPMNYDNPYIRSRTQSGFVTFGGPCILDLIARVANSSLKVAWYQKWLVHRRARPEEFAARVHSHIMDLKKYPLHADLTTSPVLGEVFRAHVGFLLPMAYPEGSPTHPAYPAGHAVVAGACATVLKAYFDESYILPDTVTVSNDGLSLLPYVAPLRVGGELNKLAFNLSMGRNFAGVHWRSDAIAGLNLGEAFALGVLSDYQECFNEEFKGFSLTRFDGTKARIK